MNPSYPPDIESKAEEIGVESAVPLSLYVAEGIASAFNDLSALVSDGRQSSAREVFDYIVMRVCDVLEKEDPTFERDKFLDVAYDVTF